MNQRLPMTTVSEMFLFVCPGKGPSQQFTALIHTVTPLQSQLSPVVKLIIAVAKSKFCAQVGTASPSRCDLVLLLQRELRIIKTVINIYTPYYE